MNSFADFQPPASIASLTRRRPPSRWSRTSAGRPSASCAPIDPGALADPLHHPVDGLGDRCSRTPARHLGPTAPAMRPTELGSELAATHSPSVLVFSRTPTASQIDMLAKDAQASLTRAAGLVHEQHQGGQVRQLAPVGLAPRRRRARRVDRLVLAAFGHLELLHLIGPAPAQIVPVHDHGAGRGDALPVRVAGPALG
jgi:hypothetical protein